MFSFYTTHTLKIAALILVLAQVTNDMIFMTNLKHYITAYWKPS